MDHPAPSTRLCRLGFTLVETAIATLLVGGLLIVAMNMVGASRVTQASYAHREQAALLAEDFLQEIIGLSYNDPESGGAMFGIEAGESLSLRSSFDDVDDYHGYLESPLADVNGNVIPRTQNITRRASVQWVMLDDPATVQPAETGLKRITVTVTQSGSATVTLKTYVTDVWPNVDEMVEVLP